MAGNTIIVILLVPILFQIFLLSIQQKKRHEEFIEMMNKIEDRLNKLAE